MNERIQELIEQSTERYLDWGGENERTELNAEKLAELIVRECMNIAKNWQDQLENANSLSESNAVGIVAYRIARQFGVKE